MKGGMHATELTMSDNYSQHLYKATYIAISKWYDHTWVIPYLYGINNCVWYMPYAYGSYIPYMYGIKYVAIWYKTVVHHMISMLP